MEREIFSHSNRAFLILPSVFALRHPLHNDTCSQCLNLELIGYFDRDGDTTESLEIAKPLSFRVSGPFSFERAVERKRAGSASPDLD